MAAARVLVCVTRQHACERLIRAGAGFVMQLGGGQLSVVHVAPHGAGFLGSESEGEALEYLFGIAKEHDADMTVLRSGDTVRSLVRHARNKRATHIILGVSPNATGSLPISAELERQLPDTQIIHVSEQSASEYSASLNGE